MKRRPYGIEEYIEHHGSGECAFRDESSGQPWALQSGDTLANGLVIIADPNEAGNGGVGLDFDDGSRSVVPARIPLLLEGGVLGKKPFDLHSGDILRTGDVVLSPVEELSEEDPEFKAHENEAIVGLTGGFSGHYVGVPRDLTIALHGESYPPSPQDSVFGAFVIEKTLKMGARARRNLPNYGRLTDEPEFDRVTSVFGEVDRLRSQAQQQRAAYREKIKALQERCTELRGVELLITGRLQGRGGTSVYSDDPKSQVENLHVEVTTARVETYEGHGGLVTEHLPFISFNGRTIDGDEQVSAWIGVDKFGITAQVASNDQS